ncbi:MAG: hypothetical protein J4N69_04060 [Chloroflexi bacterium]|nr:hypothetical protein [Chloroflexota bacterium]MCH8893702.1 hypothetical protein [Chloroflexota bacterium]MCH9016676.1 hypothetical protein [Chloroflexota bacterium]MCI0788488.1 hypothetical protein [Chloroflexota bacterium]MCI0801275.1 hypothetical protein [Chloroflexota bacterium]
MATKIAGETYRGEAITLPLSQDGQVSIYVWPCRILNVSGVGMGGPTIGVDVGNEEVIRYDCHDTPGHWHKGGYDRLGRPGNSHTDFPEGLVRVADQVEWALSQIKDNGTELLEGAEYGDAAKLLDAAMVEKALDGIRSHIKKNSGLRDQAISDTLIDA